MQPNDLFDDLQAQPADGLLSLIALHRADPRRDKIDLGVGVYRDAEGKTPVMPTVKAAEAMLVERQDSKSYLGPEGNVEFVRSLQPIIFGDGAGLSLFGVQTPGGTGALRLAAELVNEARPDARIWLGTPTWPNHHPIFTAAGLQVRTFPYFDTRTQTILFDETIGHLGGASRGDLVLLHGCCHNPSGADLAPAQWKALAALVNQRGLIPLIDFAYQGLGEGLEPDAQGLRLMIEAADDALVAYSCDKNFGLYRERTGALYVPSRRPARLGLLRSNILALARANWSMPPDHGAAVVATILQSDALSAQWRQELEDMCQRIFSLRAALADADPALDGLCRQRGMFSLLDISVAQVLRLRNEFAIYMPESGRINLAGLSPSSILPFITALRAV